MRAVERSEILDYVTYGEQRTTIRASAIAAKEARRVIAADGVLTFLFENRETVRYQVQEMMRVERIVKETDILHELTTYNELLGGPGEVGCTLLVGLADEAERNEKLRAWVGLCTHLYAKLEDGTLVRPSFDPRQVGDDRLSSVQYLKFDTGGRVPVALGADHRALTAEAVLGESQRAALADDLRSD